MDNSKSITAGSILSLVLAAGLCFAGAQKAAAAEIYNKDGTKIEFTTEIGLGLFHVTQDFGASPLRQPLNNVSWAEGYAIMGFKLERTLENMAYLSDPVRVRVNVGLRRANSKRPDAVSRSDAIELHRCAGWQAAGTRRHPGCQSPEGRITPRPERSGQKE